MRFQFRRRHCAFDQENAGGPEKVNALLWVTQLTGGKRLTTSFTLVYLAVKTDDVPWAERYGNHLLA